MNPSRNSQLKLLIYSWLILALIIPLAGFQRPSPQQVSSAQANVSQVIPFLGVFTGLRSRNRVYRTANDYIAERRQYYDRLRETARQQLRDREIHSLSNSQVAAYTRMVALIEQERASAIEFAESEKRAARQQFMDTVEAAVITRILGSGLAQDLFQAMSRGIGSAQDALDLAMGKLAGESGFMTDVNKVRNVMVKVNSISSVIGGRTGREIQRVTGNIIETIDKPREEIEAGINQVQQELGQLGETVTELQGFDREINVSQVAEQAAVTVVTGEEGDDPAISAIVGLLAGKLQREGSSFRERARGALLGTFIARCAAIGQRYRRQLELLENQPEADTSGDGDIFSPCNAIDLNALEQELADQEAQASQTEQATEIGDQPTLAVQALTKTKSDCGDFLGGGQGVFCNVTLDIALDYYNFEQAAVITCADVFTEPIGEAPVTEGSGSALFSISYERTNSTLFEGDWRLLACEATIDDELIAALYLTAGEYPWSE